MDEGADKASPVRKGATGRALSTNPRPVARIEKLSATEMAGGAGTALTKAQPHNDGTKGQPSALPPPDGAAAARRERKPARLGKRPAPVRPALSMTSQEAPIEEAESERDALWLAIAAAMRLTSFAFILAALAFWAELIGYRGSSLTLSWHALEGPWLQTFFCALAFPIVAIGLWLLANWGVVVWVSVSALAFVLYALTPWSPDFAVLAIVLNAAMMLALAAGAILRHRRNAADEAH